MSVTRALVGLYPPAVRARWGPELEEEARRDGPRGWPDLAVNLIRLWAHPAIWPATSVARRRARAANLAIGLTGAGWLTGHALLELSASVPRALAHSWVLEVCDAVTFLGFLLVLPLPHPSAWPALSAVAARRLSAPVLLGAGVAAVANHPSVGRSLPLLICWWLALSLAVVQVARTVASVEPPPGPRRLTIGLWFAVLGLTSSAAVFISATLATGNDMTAGIIAGSCLATLAATGGGTIRDLGTVA
jgi:hypothetical protein